MTKQMAERIIWLQGEEDKLVRQFRAQPGGPYYWNELVQRARGFIEHAEAEEQQQTAERMPDGLKPRDFGVGLKSVF